MLGSTINIIYRVKAFAISRSVKGLVNFVLFSIVVLRKEIHTHVTKPKLIFPALRLLSSVTSSRV